MNLFRSEEHARNWVDFDPAMDHLLKPLSEWADIFSNPFFRRRDRSDYISWIHSDAGQAAFTDLRASLSP